MDEKSITQQIKAFLKERFDLNADKAEQAEVHDNIQRGTEFRGTNLWVLIFAIIIASVGLNINSTAVIIGAMLISPLMGPIMGIGFSLGINDFDLLKKSAKNFIFAVSVSLLASTLYFMITPMSMAQSELLARTTPSTWDVMIATFGGLAGIVAASRRDRTSTVIPGVAIATALMPPLCTAGFGLATGQMNYLAGALYLFFINAVFIAFSTFFIVRFMKYERKQMLDPKRAKRVRHSIIIIIMATLIPSIILTYGIVQRTSFETSAQKFVAQYFSGGVSNIKFAPAQGSTIEVTMVVNIPADSIGYARAKMSDYGLEGVRLIVNHPEKLSNLPDHSTLQYLLNTGADRLNEKDLLISELRKRLTYYTTDTIPTEDVVRELAVLERGIEMAAISKADVVTTDGKLTKKITLCVLTMKPHAAHMSHQHVEHIKEWLKQRTKAEDVELIVNYSTPPNIEN